MKKSTTLIHAREKEERILELVTRIQEETFSSQKQPLGPWFLPHPSPYPWLFSVSHLDTVNKSLTLSRLLGFPVLWILQGNTLCQFNQMSLTVFTWSQYSDDCLKHPSSPSWFLQVRLWNLSKAKPIFFSLSPHHFFFRMETSCSWTQEMQGIYLSNAKH